MSGISADRERCVSVWEVRGALLYTVAYLALRVAVLYFFALSQRNPLVAGEQTRRSIARRLHHAVYVRS